MKTKKKIVKKATKKSAIKKSPSSFKKVVQNMHKKGNLSDGLMEVLLNTPKSNHDAIMEKAMMVMDLPNVKMIVTDKNDNDVVCHFSFYEQIVHGKHTATVLAECNDVYGEGIGWSCAVADCIEKMTQQGVLIN